MITGRIFDIQRFSTHDGPGIRTTVFLKGCQMKCPWCHNPEGMNVRKEIGYYKNKCIGCGECVKACKNNALAAKYALIAIDRNACIGCGNCAAACNSNALVLYGEDKTPKQIADTVMKDKCFYGADGGITISGGEPLLQSEFTYEILRLCKENGIHTAIETNGLAEFEKLERLMQVCDLFLFDVKCISKQLALSGLGVDNSLSLDNLVKLSEQGANVWVRIPVIPAFNDTDEETEKINVFLKQNKLHQVSYLPFHNYASEKYKSLDLTYTYENSKANRGNPQELSGCLRQKRN